MSRESTRRQVLAPRYETITSYKCDGCDGEISPDEHEGQAAHELIIQLDGDQCVNFFRQRDYCPACLDPIWEAVNKLIGADPDAERDREYE